MQMINIGERIKLVVEHKGMPVSEFARRINKSRENVYSIFKRTSIDTDLLATISDILEHDFFQYYYKSDELQKLKEENQTLRDVISVLRSGSSS